MKLTVQLHSTGPIRLDADFDCDAGELVALVGPSGSGKTSILRGIAGLLGKPGHVDARVGGRVELVGGVMGDLVQRSVGEGVGSGTVADAVLGAANTIWFDSTRGINLPPQARRCGMVFQHYALFPHLNAIENIAVGAYSTLANDQKHQLAQDLLARWGMADLGARLPRQLSGGQQQRVALARALMRIGGAQADSGQSGQATGDRAQNGHSQQTACGVLLLDEPFSAVDAPMRQTLYRELAQLRQNLRLPIILVTHDLTEARRLADRVVIVDAGATLQSGPPERVLRSPRNARVAELVGIHNHFAGHFYKSSDAQKATVRWGSLDLRVVDKSKIPHDTQVTWVLAGDLVHVLGAATAPKASDGTASLENLVLAKETGKKDHGADNVIDCILTEALPLGEISLCKLAVPGAVPDALTLNLSTAQLRAMGAQVGAHLQVAVPPDAVHIMPLR